MMTVALSLPLSLCAVGELLDLFAFAGPRARERNAQTLRRIVRVHSSEALVSP